MGKPALVVRRTEYETAPRNPERWNLMLADRDNCEKDYTLLQLIPYVVLIDTEQRKIFTYLRGRSGEESNLHSKLSIGLGGHMDELPGDRSLTEFVMTEALREVEEEIGIKFDNLDDMSGLAQIVQHGLGHTFVLETSNPVDLKHLCIPIVINIGAPEIEEALIAEEKVIEEPLFMDFEQALQISDGHVQGMTFEFWSVHILQGMRQLLEKVQDVT